MIEIQMTGICKDCDKAKLYLWNADPGAYTTDDWRISCEYENICKRVEKLCKTKAKGAENETL